jgi:hypothetical protein
MITKSEKLVKERGEEGREGDQCGDLHHGRYSRGCHLAHRHRGRDVVNLNHGPEDARGAFGAPMLLAWRHGRPECSPAPDSGAAKTRAEGTVLADTLDEANERRGGRGRSSAPLRGRLGRIHTSAGRGQPGVVARRPCSPLYCSRSPGPYAHLAWWVMGAEEEKDSRWGEGGGGDAGEEETRGLRLAGEGEGLMLGFRARGGVLGGGAGGGRGWSQNV